MSSSTRADKLRALVQLVSDAADTVVEQWDKEDTDGVAGDGTALPSIELYNAQRVVLAACGSFAELVQDPRARVLEVSTEYLESRAFHIAVERCVADHLSTADPSLGMSVFELSKKTGIHAPKLLRIMRALCSAHLFMEFQEGRFINNRITESLVGNAPLRAYLLTHAGEIYEASRALPDVLADPVKGLSTSVACCAFQDGLDTKLPLWEWLEEGIISEDGSLVPRPELENFGVAMLGLGREIGKALYDDYPWGSLGSATVVDVGGGVGEMSLELHKRYPDLRFVIQDRAPVIAQAKSIWESEHPDALQSGRLQLMPHDFFTENPVKGAEVYLLRTILHDWEDDACVKILSALTPALGPHSRILVADQVMNTTVGCEELPSASYPLLANHGTARRFAHEHDMDMLTVLNGAEHTPADFRKFATQAGLEMTRIWECRGVLGIVEMKLPQASTI